MSQATPNIESIFQLTPVQEGILFHVDAAVGTASVDQPYVQQFTCLLGGTVDADAFHAAWQLAVERHTTLRTFFTWRGRPHPLQVVRRSVAMPLEVLDEGELLDDRSSVFESWLAADRARGFDLEKAPLSRVTLMRDGRGGQRMVWTFHHLILDGWSMRVVLDEVLRSAAGRGSIAAAPEATQESYVAWLNSQDGGASAEFWRRALADVDGPTHIAAAAPVASMAPGVSATYGEMSLRLDRGATAALSAFARQSKVTLGVCLRAAWAATLSAFSGEDDVVFGATVAGRAAPLGGIERAVGMFINTVPVRAKVRGDEALGDWLRRLHEDQLSAVAAESMGLSVIRRLTDVPAGASLFDTILVVENHAAAGAAASPIEILEPRYIERSNYALALLVVPGDELELISVFDGARVAPDTASAMLHMAARVLRSMGASSEGAKVAPLLEAPAQEAPLVSAWADPSVANAKLDAGKDLVGSIARWGASGNAAVLANGVTWSHAELHRRALLMAGRLVHWGVAPGDRVAVQLGRGPEAIASILGILYAGAAYVPIDPEAPAARRDAVMRGSGARLLLDETSPILDGKDADLSLVEPLEVAPESLAYVLFTSGSTGEPKGVEISRRSLALSTSARAEVYAGAPMGADSRFLLLSPLHFDSSVAGLFWTLQSGGALVLPGAGEERDVRTLSGLSQRFGVTHTLALPSLLDAWLDGCSAGELASLRCVIVAGEACPAELPRSLASRCPKARLWNEYGPTEATVWATVKELRPDGEVTIGAPIGGAVAYVLGPGLRPVPRGVAGELCLAGPGLAVGYAGDRELTASRFPRVSLGGDAPVRVYRTGDRVRVTNGGELAFLGRVDDQVKIRGHRVELAEVEAGVAASPLVDAAVAAAKPGPGGRGKRLVVYVTSAQEGAQSGDQKSVTSGQILRDAGARLSGALLPNSVEILEAFPRTPSGKVDRRALLERADADPTSRVAPLAPRNDLEVKLHGIWSEVLGQDAISVSANFFELGGDSLLSIRILSRAHKAGLEITPAEFHDRPTIEGLAQAVATRALVGAPGGTFSGALGGTRSPEPAASGAVPLTPVQRWFFQLDLPERHHWNMSRVVEIAAAPAPAGADRVRIALAALVERHDALRLRFDLTGHEPSASVGAAAPPALEVVELSGLSDEERKTAAGEAALRAQTGFDLSAGSLLAAVLFSVPPVDGPSKLLLTAHHLVVDAVSWETLIEDFQGAYAAPGLARDGAGSWASWAMSLDRLARSEELASEADYWSAVASTAPLAKLRRSGSSEDPVDGERSFEVALPEAATRALLEDVPPVYGTRVMDVLLCALERAMAWAADESYAAGEAAITIDVESHGRERLTGATDPSEAVGWFTCVWPLALQLLTPVNLDEEWGGKAVGEALKSVKERLREVPKGGIGFGLLAGGSSPGGVPVGLRSMAPRAALFNYLGRLEGDPLGEAQWTGPQRSSLGQRAYALEINAWVSQGSLRVRWAFGAGFGEGSTPGASQASVLGEAAAKFIGGLEAIVEHCADPDAGGKTLSDFPLAGLDQAGFDRLNDLLGED